MSEKKYKIGGYLFNLKAVVNRGRYHLLMAIASEKGLDKNQIVDAAIKEYTEKNKGVLG